MNTIDVYANKSEDGIITIKVSQEQFDEIQYAIEILNYKRERSREAMREKRSTDGNDKHKRIKKNLNVILKHDYTQPNANV